MTALIHDLKIFADHQALEAAQLRILALPEPVTKRAWLFSEGPVTTQLVQNFIHDALDVMLKIRGLTTDEGRGFGVDYDPEERHSLELYLNGENGAKARKLFETYGFHTFLDAEGEPYFFSNPKGGDQWYVASVDFTREPPAGFLKALALAVENDLAMYMDSIKERFGRDLELDAEHPGYLWRKQLADMEMNALILPVIEALDALFFQDHTTPPFHRILSTYTPEAYERAAKLRQFRTPDGIEGATLATLKLPADAMYYDSDFQLSLPTDESWRFMREGLRAIMLANGVSGVEGHDDPVPGDVIELNILNPRTGKKALEVLQAYNLLGHGPETSSYISVNGGGSSLSIKIEYEAQIPPYFLKALAMAVEDAIELQKEERIGSFTEAAAQQDPFLTILAQFGQNTAGLHTA